MLFNEKFNFLSGFKSSLLTVDASMPTHHNHSTTKTLTFLWCVPRSISTAFEKMMWCSGQFSVVSEPFIDLYKRSLLSEEDLCAAQMELRETCEELLSLSRDKPVFVKDMAYHANPFLSDSFIEAINNTFLIRDPRLSIPSLYRMRENFTDAETGFKSQYELFQRIKKIAGKSPLIVDGEQLKKQSKVIVTNYFRYINRPMPADILTWDAGSREDWVGRESWHIDAINSKGFEQFSDNTSLDGLPQKVLDSIDRNMFYFEEMSNYLMAQDNAT